MAIDPSKILPSTMIAKRDYGIKIAMKGYDAEWASDNQLLYNSSFPVLAVVSFLNDPSEWEVVFSGQSTEADDWGNENTMWRHKIRFHHGLGYAPMVINLPGATWDEKFIYLSAEFSNESDYNAYRANPPKMAGIVLAVDISHDVEYPYLDVGLPVEWGQSYDYGLKHLLTDYKDSKDPMDLGLNANIQSLMVVAVKVAQYTGASDLAYYKPSGISPDNLTPFCFVSWNSKWREAGLSGQAATGYRPPSSDTDGHYVLDGQTFSDACSLVLVRLPMIAPDIQKGYTMVS